MTARRARMAAVGSAPSPRSGQRVSRGLVGLCVLAWLGGGCGPRLARELDEVRRLIDEARAKGAYRCAPRELARAEARADFVRGDLDHGEALSARRELEAARRSAREALASSSIERCGKKPTVSSKDTDGDGLQDREDGCPTEPEDRDGFEDADGCPDPDNDGDGLPDVKDACPDDAEDLDGFSDEDGCPEPDNDSDGVPDAEDRCPLEPGPAESGGCPDADVDGDTVPDRVDRCPQVPGPSDNEGCPRTKLVEVKADKIELRQKVHFATDKATILPDSFAMLDEVSRIIRSREELRVRVEGHTDSRGSGRRNMRLSQARAESVRAYLVAHGVKAVQLEAVGYGPSRPVADNKTALGREQNRRVEFIILSAGGTSPSQSPTK